jgi:hypothetical protein
MALIGVSRTHSDSVVAGEYNIFTPVETYAATWRYASNPTSDPLSVRLPTFRTMADLLLPGERTALRRALELGYFAVPRRATLVEVATDLDRSDAAVSRELRRGIGIVLGDTDVLTAPATGTESDGSRSLDRAFDALRHPYRRRILLLVGEHEPRDEAAFAADTLATDDDDLALLTTELYHVHLPKLATAGYVDWDEDAHTVRRGPAFDEVAPLLRLLCDHREELPGGWP